MMGCEKSRWQLWRSGRAVRAVKKKERDANRSQFVVVDVTRHGACDQIAAQAITEQFSKFVDEVAQIGSALEGHTGHAWPKG